MPANYKYTKTEKLKSRKLLDQLFTKGKSVTSFPVKAFYMPLLNDRESKILAGVGVSSRNFPKAVDRNRVKRLLRECYRLNKEAFSAGLKEGNKNIAVFFLYTGKELPELKMLEQCMLAAFIKLHHLIAKV